MVIVGFVGRHQRRDIAQYEQFAGTSVENRFGRDTRVATTDDHRRRFLTLDGKLFQAVLFGAEPAGESVGSAGYRDSDAGRAARGPRVAGAGLRRAAVELELDGGVLHIQWRENDGHVLMTGAATHAYRGEIDLAALVRA